MKIKSVLAIGSMCAAFALGQSTSSSGSQSTTPSGSGQTTSQSGQATTSQSGQTTNNDSSSATGNSWSGVLVASGCNASSMQSAWSGGSMGDRSGMNRSTGAAGSASADMNRTTNATAGRDTNAPNTGNAGSGASAGTSGSVSADRADNRSGSTTAGSADRAGQTGTQAGDLNRSTVGDRSVNNPQTGMADRDRGADTQATASGSASGGREWEAGGTGANNWDKACFISPTTSSFVLLTQDGRQVRLDDASNQLIMQRLQSTNRVSQKGKIFRVRVNGNMSGDTLHATDIQM